MTVSKRSPAPGLMKDLEPRKLTLTKRPNNREDFTFTKSMEKTMNIAELIEEHDIENEDELRKALSDSDMSEDAVDGLVSGLRAISAFSDEVTGEDLNKALDHLGYDVGSDSADSDTDTDPGGVQKSDRVRELESELEKREDRLQKVEGKLDDLLDQKEQDKWLEKVEGLEVVSGDPEDLAKTLKTIEENLGEEAAENHLDSLRSADKLASEGDPFGAERGVAGASGTTDAESELEKRMAEVRKNADGDLSDMEAKKRAIRDMPESKRNELLGA